MKIAILEAAEDLSVTPRHYRTKSYCLKLVSRGVADWVAKTVIKLRKGITLLTLGQRLAAFHGNEVWHPTFEVTLDPALRESPSLRYPILLARRQQSFAYSGAAYA